MSKRIIYGLADPDTHEMRYVGASITGMKRPLSHLRPSGYDGKYRNSHVYRWIRTVFDRGLKPEIVVIEEIADDVNPFDVEPKWIAHYRSLGCRLTNHTDGGEGRLGYKASAETKAKLAARIHTPEWRERMSQAQRRRYSMPNAVSEETRRRLSEAGKRANQNPETKKRLSAAQKARRQRERDSNPNKP